jgi:hypothetical protein
MSKTIFISTLSAKTKQAIASKLQSIGLSESDIDTAMNSRICDLEDTIDISKILK